MKRFILGTTFGITAVLLAQQAAAQSQRFPQLENDVVKIWRSVVIPNAPLAMHRHDHPRVVVALKGGTMKLVEESGKSQENQWETGKAYYLPANPALLHADVNAGKEPIEVMVIELKKEN